MIRTEDVSVHTPGIRAYITLAHLGIVIDMQSVQAD